LKLPEDSLYTSIEGTIRDRANGIDGAKRMEPEEYAKRVVADILKGKTGKIWHGWSAGTVKFSTTFLPTSLMVSYLSIFFPREFVKC
jgi:1-acylglycerone phosphate reductase